MRLIDADALKELLIEVLEHIKENPKMDGQEKHIIAGIFMLGEMIDDAPTVDAVPVIRCKDCKHAEREDDGDIMCTFWDFCECNHHVLDNGYCDRAERKEE